MKTITQDNFKLESTTYLLQALAAMREILQGTLDGMGRKFILPAVSNPNYLPALVQLTSTFNLSVTEQKILLLCVGCELDTDFEDLCASLNGNPELNYPTFNLALSIFPDFYLDLLDPQSPLQRNQIISVGEGNLISCSVKVNRRILHYLLGQTSIDPELTSRIKEIDLNFATAHLSESHLQITRQIELLLQLADSTPLIHLCGTAKEILLNLAKSVAYQIGVKLYYTTVSLLPTNPEVLDEFMFRWRRETYLSRCLLLLDCENLGAIDPSEQKALSQFLSNIAVPIIVTSDNRLPGFGDSLTTIDVSPLTPVEQRKIWMGLMGDRASLLNGEIDSLVTNFQLTPSGISNAAFCALSSVEEPDDPIALSSALWNACRTQARPSLDNYAQRIDAKATWNDLILPEKQKQILLEMVAEVRQRTQVYEKWGFGSKNNRGLGTSALFAGVPGTGKTMAAEVIGGELGLDVYRIDLSATVSKYIGETEKNLAKLFDAAEIGGVILLFDEGDSLFGKRSEVKDSKDRYANMEVSYLLQRLETYSGLSIITTNIKDALDTAFMRRLRFIVEFPFPEEEQRALIWRRVFPAGVLDIDESRDFEKLARLNVAGGNIKSIALRSAFLAAEEGKKIQMIHLLKAAESEYIKMECTLTEAEIYGWV